MEEATDNQGIVGKSLCNQVAPESAEVNTPPKPGQNDAAATSFEPSAEQATESQLLTGAPLGVQLTPESAEE
jgi:hypothetical protein